jgi:hypothetical protein
VITSIDEAHEALQPLLVLLTSEERSSLPKPPDGFPDAARRLAAAMVNHPEIAAVTEFDAEALVEDLDNVAALEQLATSLDNLQALLTDSRLAWLAEAYAPSLALYGVAKIRARLDAKLEQSIAPLAEVFATRRAKKKPA